MRSITLAAAAGLLAAAAGFSGVAASEHVGSEMLATESAVPVEEGAVDIEVGMTYTKANSGKRGAWSNNWSRSRRESFRMYEWTLRATKGIAPDTDFSIETGWVDMYDRQWGRAFTGDSGHTPSLKQHGFFWPWRLRSIHPFKDTIYRAQIFLPHDPGLPINPFALNRIIIIPPLLFFLDYRSHWQTSS